MTIRTTSDIDWISYVILAGCSDRFEFKKFEALNITTRRNNYRINHQNTTPSWASESKFHLGGFTHIDQINESEIGISALL